LDRSNHFRALRRRLFFAVCHMNETELVKRYRNGDLLSDIEKLKIFALQDSGRFDEIEALDQIQGTLLSQIHNRIECSGIIGGYHFA